MIAIRERSGRRALGQDEVAADDPGNAPAVVSGDRHVHPHDAWTVGDVPLPSHPEQHEALAHQRAVAEFRLACRIGGSDRLLKGGEHRLAAAVADLIKESSVAPPRVCWLEQIEVGAELDLAPRTAWSELQIDDPVVAGKLRIEGEVHLADQFFVRSGCSERTAAEDGLAPLDAQPHDARFGRGEG